MSFDELAKKHHLDIEQPKFNTDVFKAQLKMRVKDGIAKPGVRNECAYTSGWSGELSTNYHRFFSDALHALRLELGYTGTCNVCGTLVSAGRCHVCNSADHSEL